MINSPLISIITSTYNAEEYLEELILSTLSQTYKNVELIFIDGNSQDNTVNILQKYSDQISYWISEPDTGIYDAWNKGLKQATGEWITFIGADDYWWNDKVLEKVSTIISNASKLHINYVYGTVNRITEDKILIEQRGVDWEVAKKTFYNGMKFTHAGSFHHKSLFSNYGNFDTTFKICGDYEFLVRCVKAQEDALYAKKITTIGMRMGGISNHSDTKLKMARELKKAIKKNNVTHNSLLHLLWVLKLRIKKILF